MANMRKPLFHVLLNDRDQWGVEVEWPDGVLERIRSFKHYATAADWVANRSEAWLRVRSIFDDQAVDAIRSAH